MATRTSSRCSNSKPAIRSLIRSPPPVRLRRAPRRMRTIVPGRAPVDLDLVHQLLDQPEPAALRARTRRPPAAEVAHPDLDRAVLAARPRPRRRPRPAGRRGRSRSRTPRRRRPGSRRSRRRWRPTARSQRPSARRICASDSGSARRVISIRSIGTGSSRTASRATSSRGGASRKRACSRAPQSSSGWAGHAGGEAAQPLEALVERRLGPLDQAVGVEEDGRAGRRAGSSTPHRRETGPRRAGCPAGPSAK